MIGLPIFGWMFIIAWSHFRRFEDSERLSTFTFGSKIPSWHTRIWIAIAKLFAMAIIITGLTEPYINRPVSEPKYKNVRIFILMDVSGSMAYAEDVQPNRLEAVRKEVIKFYNKLDGNYEVSVIPFAGSPNPYYCPLTYSKSVFIPLMEKIGLDSAPTLGTNIAAAFDALKEQIKKDKLDESGVNVVVLITDGGKEEADAANRIKLFQAVNQMADKNSKVYVVGVGGGEPAVLVKRDRKGAFIEYVKEDDKIAYSDLDEEILKQVAAQGKGDYLHFDKGDQLEPFLSEVLKENRIADESGSVVYKKLAIQPYLFAAAAVLLWLSFIANRRRKVSNGTGQQIITGRQVDS